MRISLNEGDTIPLSNLSLGGDPEFEVYDLLDREVVYAGMLSPSLRSFGPIGLDGSGAQVELRPLPAKSPSIYVENAWALIGSFHRYYDGNYRLCLQGDTYPLGGHIHIGSTSEEEVEFLQFHADKFVCVLDDFVGRVLLPTSGWARGRYYCLSSFELKPWGWEYRTPPASFYIDPLWVYVVYKLTFKLVKELAFRGELSYERDANGVPLEREYLRFLTREELEIFMSFPRKWERMREEGSVFPPQKEVKRTFLYLSHSDEWDEDKWSAFKNALQNIKPKEPLEVVLYGLKESRGEVWAIRTAPEVFRLRDPFPKPEVEEGPIPTIWVGVPYRWRRREVPPKRLLSEFKCWVKELLAQYGWL